MLFGKIIIWLRWSMNEEMHGHAARIQINNNHVECYRMEWLRVLGYTQISKILWMLRGWGGDGACWDCSAMVVSFEVQLLGDSWCIRQMWEMVIMENLGVIESRSFQNFMMCCWVIDNQIKWIPSGNVFINCKITTI